jgi:hypothetical protein
LKQKGNILVYAALELADLHNDAVKSAKYTHSLKVQLGKVKVKPAVFKLEKPKKVKNVEPPPPQSEVAAPAEPPAVVPDAVQPIAQQPLVEAFNEEAGISTKPAVAANKEHEAEPEELESSVGLWPFPVLKAT